MSKFNLQSLAFALIVLFFALLGRREGAHGQNQPSAGKISVTSLTAQATNIIPEIGSSAEEPSVKVSKSAQTEEPKTKAEPALKPIQETSLDVRGRYIDFVEPESSKIVALPPVIYATAATAKEIGSASPLYEKNSLKRWPLASITKLMTAAVALENIRPDQRVMMAEEAIATEGESGNFQAGEVFTADDLIKALLLVSSNDAAEALALFLGKAQFLELMRDKAFLLGMRETTFFDASGLSVANQSNIADLEKLAAFILKNHPSIFAVTATPKAEITEINSGTRRALLNINKFAGTPEFVGGKTGYTSDANGNLLSVFRNRGRYFLTAVFGANDRFGETEKLLNWIKENF